VEKDVNTREERDDGGGRGRGIDEGGRKGVEEGNRGGGCRRTFWCREVSTRGERYTHTYQQ